MTEIDNQEREGLVFLDYYQTEQLGLWLRYYPEIPLRTELLSILITNSKIAVCDESIHFIETLEGKWQSEVEYLFTNMLYRVVNKTTPFESFLIFSGKSIDFKNTSEFEDVINLQYCIRNKIPMSFSSRIDDYNEIIKNLFNKTFTKTSTKDDININNKGLTIAKWITEIETPALYSRSEIMRNTIFKDTLKQGYAFYNNIKEYEIDWGMTNLMYSNIKDYLNDGIFISPAELIDILSNKSAILKLRSTISEFALSFSSKYQVNDGIREINDKKEFKIKIGEIIFTGVDLSLSWIPFTSTISTILKTGYNFYINKSNNWLIFLNTVNRKIRNSTKK